MEEAGKSCSAGSVMQTPEEPPPDQVFQMFPDVSASHQRPFCRENQQTAVCLPLRHHTPPTSRISLLFKDVDPSDLGWEASPRSSVSKGFL